MVDPKHAELPLPAATGKLAQRPLAHLLIYSRERQLTGTLELRSPQGAHVTIALAHGKVAKVETSDKVAFLGLVLYEQGHIDDRTLSETLATLASTRRLHGSILLEAQAISHEQLHEALRNVRSRKLHHAFSLPEETDFAYYAQVDVIPDRPHDVEPMDALGAVWRALREAPPSAHMKATLAKIGDHALRVDAATSLDALELNDTELAATELLRLRALNIPELVAAGFSPAAWAERLVYFLIVTKHAEIVSRADVSQPPQASSIPPRSSSSGSGQYARPVSFSMRVHGLHSETPPGVVSSVPPKISSAPSPAQSIAPKATPASVSSIPPPSAQTSAKRQAIVERAAALEQEDYFRVLGVERRASAEEIRDAFFNLAKQWHPDRLPPALVDVRRDAMRIFAKMTAAFETLTDADRRKRYEEQIDTRKQELVEAEALVGQAEMNMVLGDYEKAEQLCRKAIATHPPGRAEHLALLAWLEAREKKGADFTRSKIAQIDIALGKDPSCRRAHYYRAMLYKRLESHESAIRDLRRAVELDADDAEAERELRVYEYKVREGQISLTRQTPSSGTETPKSSGLFERFRRKKDS